MRNLARAATAVPTLVGIYLSAAARRSSLLRFAIGVTLVAVAGIGYLVATGPAPTIATPPSVPVPLTSAAFRTAVTTGATLDAPMTIQFSTPMRRESVEAAIRVEPATALDLGWDAAGRRLTVAPVGAWRPDTLHTITVDAGALALTGRPLSKPMRTAFLTRAATAGEIAATATAGRRARVTTAFTITFARPVEIDSVLDSLQSVPPIVGTMRPVGGLAAGTTFTFTPSAPLQADTRYRLTVHGVRTPDGELLGDVTAGVTTARAPLVERIRPKGASTDVPRDAAISIRFSESMHVASTREALTVMVNGKAVPGATRFAEENTVLVFEPASRFPYEAQVRASMGAGARSAVGTPIADTASAAFTVAKKPVPRIVPPAPAASSGGGSTSVGSGGTGGGGSWASVERYYLGLMNCTRTGGWVTSTGSCSSPGGRDVAALRLDSGISTKVARPYAKLLATSGQCSHFANGGPDDRLRRAGYTSYRWAENIGCRSGAAKAAVLATHLFFQSEQSYNGGHWVNMMSSKYDRVGIGVWVSGGRVRLVVDFYHP